MGQGTKVWSYPSQPTDEDLLIIRSYGFTKTEKLSQRLVQLELEEQSLFLLPAGTPHHVFTPSNCLASGGFFLTARTLARTLKAAELGDRCGDYTNDGAPPQIHVYYDFLLKWYGSTSEEVLLKSGCGINEIADVVRALEDYTYTGAGAKKGEIDQAAMSHFRRKRDFIQACRDNSYIAKIKTKHKR